MNAVVSLGNLSLTSLQIAEYTEKPHKHVLRDIRDMLSELGHSDDFMKDIYISDRGRNYEIYKLDKRHTSALLMGYSAVLRLKVIDRVNELEQSFNSTQVAEVDSLKVMRDEMRAFQQDVLRRMSELTSTLSKHPKLKPAPTFIELFKPKPTKPMTSSEVGKTLGVGSSETDRMLEDQGFIVLIDRRYLQTDKSKPYCGTPSGTRIRWNEKIFECLTKDIVKNYR